MQHVKLYSSSHAIENNNVGKVLNEVFHIALGSQPTKNFAHIQVLTPNKTNIISRLWNEALVNKNKSFGIP